MNSMPMGEEFCNIERIIRPKEEEVGESTISLTETSNADEDHKTAKVKGLLEPSKKIRSKKKNDEQYDKFAKFFEKWRELKKNNRDFKQQTRFWWSGYSKTGHRTVIYRIFFNSIRIHFVLAIDEKGFSFENMKEENWKELFLNLIEYFIERVYELGYTFDKDTTFRSLTVLIQGLNSFKSKNILSAL